MRVELKHGRRFAREGFSEQCASRAKNADVRFHPAGPDRVP